MATGPIEQPAFTPGGGEVVMIMGLPAAGKSEAARTFVANGYTRLNRDDAGGSAGGGFAALSATLRGSMSGTPDGSRCDAKRPPADSPMERGRSTASIA